MNNEQRERLVELIGKALQDHEVTIKNYAIDEDKFIADYLLENNVVALPCVGDIVDTIISHNSIAAIWCEIDDYGTSELLWRGMAWDIPDEYKKLKFKRIFGTVPESIVEADSINILVDERSTAE